MTSVRATSTSTPASTAKVAEAQRPRVLDAEWHRANPMPAHASFEQRVDWHREHTKHCGCRKPPRDIAALLDEEPGAA